MHIILEFTPFPGISFTCDKLKFSLTKLEALLSCFDMVTTLIPSFIDLNLFNYLW